MPSILRPRIVFWNVNSLSSAKSVQVELMCADLKPLLVCLCECKITDVNKIPSIVGYDVIGKPSEPRSGGLITYISSRVYARRRTDLENDWSHCMWLECNLSGSIRRILVGVFYHRQVLGLNGFEKLLGSLRLAASCGIPLLVVG